jgi:hypothetical protein
VRGPPLKADRLFQPGEVLKGDWGKGERGAWVEWSVPLVHVPGQHLSLISQHVAQDLIGQVTGQDSFKNVSEAVFEGHVGFSYERV